MRETVDIPAEALSRLIGLIYGAASDDDLWPSLLQAMADFLMQSGAQDARPVSTAETDAIVASWFGDTSSPLPSTASAAEQQVFQLLAPHFVRAWDMRQTQADAETHRRISDSVLDRLPVGVALVEDTGAVVSMNRALRLILDNNDGLVLVAGRMESRPRKLLEDALREVAGPCLYGNAPRLTARRPTYALRQHRQLHQIHDPVAPHLPLHAGDVRSHGVLRHAVLRCKF